MFHGIPIIPKPFFSCDNFSSTLCRISRKNFLIRKIIFYFEKFPFIPKSKASLRTAKRAKGRSRYLHFFVKIKVLLIYDKFLLAVLAISSLHIILKSFSKHLPALLLLVFVE